MVTNTVKRDYSNILEKNNDYSTINKNTTDLNTQSLDQRIKAISSEFQQLCPKSGASSVKDQ